MKSVSKLLIPIMILIVLVGCTKTKGFTYDVETGDKIKISLKTNGGYEIDSELPFKISKDDKVLSQGVFITTESYNQYKDLLAVESEELRIIERKNSDGLDYIFYEYKGENPEYNYVIKISNSNTSILLGNSVSEASAKECFERLKITKE